MNCRAVPVLPDGFVIFSASGGGFRPRRAARVVRARVFFGFGLLLEAQSSSHVLFLFRNSQFRAPAAGIHALLLLVRHNHLVVDRPERAFHALNSEGKNVTVIEEGWAAPDETPDVMIIKFLSSCGEAFYGGVGNTLWIDNIRLEMQ